MYARSITSRKNIILSLAKKCQLKFSDFLLNGIIDDDIIASHKHKIVSSYNVLLGEEISNCYSQLKFKGTVYKIGYYLTKFTYELEFFEILEIVITNKILLIVKQIKIDYFDNHLKSYRLI